VNYCTYHGGWTFFCQKVTWNKNCLEVATSFKYCIYCSCAGVGLQILVILHHFSYQLLNHFHHYRCLRL
jgi:hypothetical protein